MRGARVYDDALAEVGLKVSQFSVLNAVASREDTRPAELAKFLEMDESTLSRKCRAHVRKGMAPAGTLGMIGAAIKSQSRKWGRLCYEKAIRPGNKRKAR